MIEETLTVETHSDEEVLWASHRRPALFKVIVARYQSAFLRRARKILGARPEVDDVVVETFTKIYLNAKKFKAVEGANFRSWAYQILKNTAFTYHAKLARQNEKYYGLEDSALENLPSAEQLEESYGLKDLVARALTVLPSVFSRILSLHFLEDRSLKEIAVREDISLAAAKTRLYRAKKEFKKCLQNF
ncbi:MAG: RNA polymerase sigma factor [Patescibacteria group bacterium]